MLPSYGGRKLRELTLTYAGKRDARGLSEEFSGKLKLMSRKHFNLLAVLVGLVVIGGGSLRLQAQKRHTKSQATKAAATGQVARAW